MNSETLSAGSYFQKSYFWRLGMNINLSSADYGYGIFDSSYSFPGISVTSERQVNCYEIEMFYETGGTTYLNNTPYRIRRGAILCVKPGSVRYSQLPLKTYYLKIKATVNFAHILDGLCDYFTSSDVEHGIEIFLELIKSNDGDMLLRHVKFLEFLRWVKNESEKARRMSVVKSRGSEAAELGIAYIESHFRESCKLEDISAYAHLSPVYFHHVFTAATGKTPYEYLTALRLEEAKRLILTGGSPMSDIAEQCGFSSQSYFNAVFKQKTGETPREYRQRILEGYFKTDGIF